MGFYDYFRNAIFYGYADFDGRASRTEYFSFIFFNLLFSGLFYFTMIWSGAVSIALFKMVTILYFCYGLFMLIPLLALNFRRLHDSNRSGWWLLFCLIPVIGQLAYIYFIFADGTNGWNDYGYDPREDDDDYKEEEEATTVQEDKVAE